MTDREPKSVYDVFTPTTQARLNFVPRPSVNDALVSALMTPGKQLIVYGETGSGKSTILQRKLEELYPAHVTTRCTSGMTFDQVLLNAFDQLGPFYMSEASRLSSTERRGGLSAEFAGIKASMEAAHQLSGTAVWTRAIPPQLTVQRLGEFIGAAGRCWLLEDFHKVDDSEKRYLAQALKVFSDLAADYRDLRLIAVGATDTAREVVEYDPEMRNRVSEVLVPLMSDEELGEIVDGGAELLNVDLNALKNSFVRYSMGVAAVTHQLALNVCFNEGVLETQSDPFVFETRHLEGSLQKWVDDSSDSVKAKFDAALRRHRVRRFDNTRLILAAMAQGPIEGMLQGEILSSIKTDEPDYPASNLTLYLRQLLTEQRGSLVILSPDGRYRFVDPLHHTYAKVALRRPAGRGGAWSIRLDHDVRSSFVTELLDLSAFWTEGTIQIKGPGVRIPAQTPPIEIED